MIIRTIDGLDAVLDESHWETHIISRHPELSEWQAQVIETLKEPVGVFRSRRDPATRIYVRNYLGVRVSGIVIEHAALLVYVREDSGFVVTAHLTVAMSRRLGEQVWPS